MEIRAQEHCSSFVESGKEVCPWKKRKSCDLNAYIENAKIKLYQIFNELEELRQAVFTKDLEVR